MSKPMIYGRKYDNKERDLTKNIHSLGFQIRDGVTLRRVLVLNGKAHVHVDEKIL